MSEDGDGGIVRVEYLKSAGGIDECGLFGDAEQL
jgi:hypothetical protein